MVLANYVDDDVPDWQTKGDDPHGMDIKATVVFLSGLTKRAFEKSSDRLDLRQTQRTASILAHARGRGSSPTLRLIDESTYVNAADAFVEANGFDELDNFVSDTLDVALSEVGTAVSYARRCGVLVTPERYASAITVRPARSFRRDEDMMRWNAGKRSAWRPSVRLTVELSLDGPSRLVEHHAEDIRRAVAACGPITCFSERGRSARSFSGAGQLPHLAASRPEAFA